VPFSTTLKVNSVNLGAGTKAILAQSQMPADRVFAYLYLLNLTNSRGGLSRGEDVVIFSIEPALVDGFDGRTSLPSCAVEIFRCLPARGAPNSQSLFIDQ
jgi:hypothetical protein